MARQKAELDPDANRSAELETEVRTAVINEDDAEEMFRVSEEILAGEGIRLQITRWLPQDQRGFAGEMLPSEFTLAAVQERFGPGTYRVRPLGPTGYVKGGGRVIIAPTPPKPAVSVEQLIQKALSEHGKGRSIDWVPLLTVLGPVVGQIMVALLSRNSQQVDVAALISAMKPAPQKDPIEILAALKSLNEPPKESPDTLERAFALVERLKDMGGGASGEGQTGWLDVVKEVARAAGPGLGSVLQNLGQQRSIASSSVPAPQLLAPAGAPAALPAPPVQSLDAGASVPQTEEEAMNLAMLRILPWFRNQLEVLYQKAQSNKSPEVWADALVDDFPEGTDPAPFVALLARQDWFELLSQFDARISPHREWFTECRDAIISILQDMQREAQREAAAARAGATTGQRRRLPDQGGRERVEVRGPAAAPRHGGETPNAPVEVDRPPAMPPDKPVI